MYTPTDGELIYQGEKLSFKAPKEAIDLGILVIHQELSVANHLTVAENIYLGCEPRRKNGMLDRKKMNRDAQAILDEMNVDMQADMLAGHLNAAQQQMIEIAKVISKQARIVIMDEPTSSLSEHEIQSLFIQIKKLIEKNVSVVYITHRMKEITEIGHRVTVLRDGCKVDTMQVKEVTEKEIVSRMVGREIGDYYHKKEHKRGKEMLRVENLSKQGVFSEISFCAYAGEIVGFSGLVGAGRTEVMEAIFGATGYEEGKVYLEGKEVLFRTPKEAIRSKIGLVTEDRRRTGLLLKKKIRENIVLPSLTRHRKKLGFLNKAWEVTSSRQYMEKLKIKAPGIDTVVGTLSGGNQQKVILAKWLVADSKILILDEPTRGIDVNARSEFYTLMNDFVEQGGAIIMISSEMPEILGVSDRIIVMREGRISGELSREEATEQRVIHMASITSEKE